MCDRDNVLKTCNIRKLFHNYSNMRSTIRICVQLFEYLYKCKTYHEGLEPSLRSQQQHRNSMSCELSYISHNTRKHKKFMTIGLH